MTFDPHTMSIASTIQRTPFDAIAESSVMTAPVRLSDEQQAVIDAARAGHDVIVDACIGSGKTSTIEQLCQELGDEMDILYLTYSRLLKLEAQGRVSKAKVQNYHGIVYPSLMQAKLKPGLSESIRVFNEQFKHLSATFPRYDLIVIDEYQDINEEYAELLTNIKTKNPLMQVVMVGDMAQKVRDDTTFDVQEFARTFCVNPVELPFTQSFRMGEQMAGRLAQAWNKPIAGANPDQTVHHISFEEAVSVLGKNDPGDLLVLGTRSGQMVNALNEIEKHWPKKFNKHSVFASIRHNDVATSGNIKDGDAAIFTTFDASKGLERSVCIIFDYGEENWHTRSSFPNTNPEILRNIFLVAASRGKHEVYFVECDGKPPIESIGELPIARFRHLPEVELATYEEPILASKAFEFKYAENIQSAFDLLDVERLDDGKSDAIYIEGQDGLIDLSPVIGEYQEAIFFEEYSPEFQIRWITGMSPGNIVAEEMFHELSKDGDPWHDSRIVAAAETEHRRYADQVSQEVSPAVQEALYNRLASLLPTDAKTQQPLEMAGLAVRDHDTETPIAFQGIIDAVHQNVPYELKYVSELTNPMFLQLAMYVVMGGYEEGVLWNTRTDERWRVRVPDVDRFLNAVVFCVTKQQYKVFMQD